MVAFLILAHADPRHVRRLAARLAPHPVHVHRDRKTPASGEWALPGVRFVTPARPAYWGGQSLVEATLDLLRDALAAQSAPSHVVLLSGACYPIKPVADLVADLESRPDEVGLRLMPVGDAEVLRTNLRGRFLRDAVLPWRLTSRFPLAGRAERVLRGGLHAVLRRTGLRSWPFPLEPYKSSQFWCLPRDCAQYVLDFSDSPAGRALRRYFRLSHAPDEFYFATVIGNSPFAARTTGEVEYRQFSTYLLANLHLIHPTLGKWYGDDDFAEVAASDRYFVRKVSSNGSAGLLDRIDRELLDAGRDTRP